MSVIDGRMCLQCVDKNVKFVSKAINEQCFSSFKIHLLKNTESIKKGHWLEKFNLGLNCENYELVVFPILSTKLMKTILINNDTNHLILLFIVFQLKLYEFYIYNFP